MIRQIKHVVRVVALELEAALLLIAPAVVEHAIRPSWVPLQTEARIIKRLALERWSEGYVTLLKEAWDVA